MSDSLPLHGPQDHRLPCPSFTLSWSLLRLMSIESVMPSNHFFLCHPLLYLPSAFPNIRVFSKLALRIGWPKYWSFSVSLSNECSGLTSFRIDCFCCCFSQFWTVIDSICYTKSRIKNFVIDMKCFPKVCM